MKETQIDELTQADRKRSESKKQRSAPPMRSIARC